jgi:acetylornithine/succinyldiaminopimelate/putrescine aminotransferase
MDQRQLFLRHVGQTSSAPLAIEIVKAEGCLMWDAYGSSYIDLIGGISVCNIGHCHPKVVDAIAKQSSTYMHVMVYGELIESPQVSYSKKIADLLPASLDCIYYTSSGTEATEGAMKLAKRLTGRTQIACFNQSYHGSTQGALSIMGSEYWRNAFRPLLPGILHLEYNRYEDLQQIDHTVSCVVVEPLQAERGVVAPELSWIKALRQRCNETGTLLILDEIQTGFGRTGSLFAFEQLGFVPDILLLGKALGGGMPLGAFVSSYENMQALTSQPVLGHISTFGGHPVCCAAGEAALTVLLEERLINTVSYKSEIFKKSLVHPLIQSFRSSGLLMAIEFDSWETNKAVIDGCISRGVFTDWFLFAAHCMRLAPPLIISEKEIQEACSIIVSVCDETMKSKS